MMGAISRRPVVAGALVLALVFFGGAFLGRKSVPVRAGYSLLRSQLVTVRASLDGPADTIVLGDSITEENNLEGVCGRTFAAGIGEARIADLQRLAPTLIQRSHPRLAVLEIGTNDVLQHKADAEFRAEYDHLLHSLPMRPFALVGVANGNNAFIASEARRIGAVYIPPVPAAMTWDGIHPNPEGGRLWRTAVAAACPLRVEGRAEAAG